MSPGVDMFQVFGWKFVEMLMRLVIMMATAVKRGSANENYAAFLMIYFMKTSVFKV